MPTLTQEKYEERQAQLARDLSNAEQAHAEAALAEATGTGGEDEVKAARERVSAIKDRMGGLAAAKKQSAIEAAERRKAAHREHFEALQTETSALFDQRTKAMRQIVKSCRDLAKAVQAWDGSNEAIQKLAMDYCGDWQGDWKLGELKTTICHGDSTGTIVGNLLEDGGLRPQTIHAMSYSFTDEQALAIDQRTRERGERKIASFAPGAEAE